MIKKTYRVEQETQQKIEELLKVYNLPSENFLFKILVNNMYDLKLKQKEEHITELDKINQEILEPQTKLNGYQNKLNQITDLQDKIATIFKDLIENNYRAIITKEKLIDALRHKKGKELENSLKYNSISEKGAQRAQKRFEKLLYNIQNAITQEKELFSLLTGGAQETINQFIEQLQEKEMSSIENQSLNSDFIEQLKTTRIINGVKDHYFPDTINFSSDIKFDILWFQTKVGIYEDKNNNQTETVYLRKGCISKAHIMGFDLADATLVAFMSLVESFLKNHLSTSKETQIIDITVKVITTNNEALLQVAYNDVKKTLNKATCNFILKCYQTATREFNLYFATSSPTKVMI